MVVTHDRALAARAAQRLVLDRGRITSAPTPGTGATGERAAGP
jgi:ABC-type lipoprotein export system ATPase subunit